MKDLILIKLGGSLITFKNKPFTEDAVSIKKICREVAQITKGGKLKIVIGHGGGSYPHYSAAKYSTINGITGLNSLSGASAVQDAAARLNRIIISELLKVGINALHFSPSSFVTTTNKKTHQCFPEPLKIALKNNFVPVVYGDLVMDDKIGFTILSTEQILNVLATELNHDYKINKIIYCGRVEGVLDEKGKVIQKITGSNFEALKENLISTKGFDVTGGMLHKVEESLNYAKENRIKFYIVGGGKKGNLYKCVTGKEFTGTEISALTI